MQHAMRRSKQELSQDTAKDILSRGTSGVLALIDAEGEPYALPLSYAYKDGRIYFHSAKVGHKVDAILANPRASFCVIDKDNVVPEEFTTYFRSAIAFGSIRISDDEADMITAASALAQKYYPGHDAEHAKVIESAKERMLAIIMDVERLTGKEAIELVR